MAISNFVVISRGCCQRAESHDLITISKWFLSNTIYQEEGETALPRHIQIIFLFSNLETKAIYFFPCSFQITK